MRLIDAEAAEKRMVELCEVITGGSVSLPPAALVAMIRSMLTIEKVTPTIDAVPVVRCKECENCRNLRETKRNKPYSEKESPYGFYCEEFGICFYEPRYHAKDYFCADGRRRESHEI